MSNYFTDDEYRILLAALGRERKICEKVDEEFAKIENNDGSKNKLSKIMASIERKIREIQYNN